MGTQPIDPKAREGHEQRFATGKVPRMPVQSQPERKNPSVNIPFVGTNDPYVVTVRKLFLKEHDITVVDTDRESKEAISSTAFNVALAKPRCS